MFLLSEAIQANVNYIFSMVYFNFKLLFKDKEEIYKDSEERGIGFIFVRLILLVILRLILYFAVNFIDVVRLFGCNKTKY